jgi:hypothetical protein
VPLLDPPDDPDEWTHEQWCEWLQAVEAEPEDPPIRRRRRTPPGSMMGAAMLGLEQAMYGKLPKPEWVEEAEADGQDDGLVLLDPDDPAASRIELRGR